MNQLIHQLKSKKYLIPTFGLAVFVLVLIIAPIPAKADFLNSMGSALVSILSWLFMAFVNVMGTLLLKAIEILIRIANYGDFLNAPIVEKGWVVVRDVSNIALVIALLYMAFATVFRKSSYQYQNLLPKLVLAAILINFSKTITGLIIDLGQVFMMTFVNAFQSAAAGNLTYGFGLHDLLAFREAAGGGIGAGAGIEESINNWSIFGALVLGSLMVLVAFLVVLSLIIMLLMRILVLWFLVMFSPIAFMSGILPSEGGLSGYVNQWWSTLWKWVLAGPAVAFMLWLSLAVISEMTAEKRIISLSLQSAASQQGSLAGTEWQAFASKMSGTQNIVDYLVTTGLLIMCLVVASKTGVTGAKFAGTALAKMEGYGQKVMRAPQMLGRKGWERAKVSYAGEAVRALAERGKKGWVGRKIGLDKDYAKEKVATRRAFMEERLGVREGAIKRDQLIKARQASEKLEEAGAFDSEYNILQTLKTETDKGNLDKALAALDKAAQKKVLTPELAKKFEEQFAGRAGGIQEQRVRDYINAAWDSQAAAGDKSVMFKRTVKAGRFGYEEVTDDAAIKDVRKVKGVQETGDVADEATVKAMSLSKRDSKSANEIFNILADRDNLGFISAQRRESLVKRAHNVLADDTENKFLDDKTRENIRRVANVLQGINTGDIKYDTRTGKALDINDIKYAFDAADQNMLYIRDKNTGAGKILSSDEGSDYLTETYESIQKADTEEGKDKRVEARLEETKVGKAVKKEIIADMDLKQDLEQIYEHRNRIALEKNENQRKVYVNRARDDMQLFILKVKEKINEEKIKVIDPETGKKYTDKNLVSEFIMNSEMGKAMSALTVENLAERDKQQVLNAFDNLITDLQDSSNWKKMAKQTIKNEEKGWRNTPEARQKARQQADVTAKRLRTNLDTLKQPQTKPKLYFLGRKTTKEMRRVKKTMDDILKSTEFIWDETYKSNVEEFNRQYDIYKKSIDDVQRRNAQEEMARISEAILGRFEST